MAVQIKCAGNQPLPPPRERIISVLYSQILAVSEGVDSVYHTKNIVTLTAIYNGFRRRELLIVPRSIRSPHSRC